MYFLQISAKYIYFVGTRSFKKRIGGSLSDNENDIDVFYLTYF